jgi:ribosomal protein S18 acetylase RimI-like enzyme
MTSFAWRPMTASDLPAVAAIAAEVHPDFPEDDAVFAERQRLFPAGCRVYAGGKALAAYVVSHPWKAGSCPPLNTLLGALPEPASTWYIHDIALLPSARGTGAAGEIVEALKREAPGAGLQELSLVAVNGSAGFWRRMGFVEAGETDIASKLASYGADARYMVCRPG